MTQTNGDVSGKNKASKMEPQRSFFHNSLHLLICASGILICYFAFGIYQERVVKGTYGSNDKFTYIQTLLFFVCLASAAFAKILMPKGSRDDVPRQQYAFCAASYLGAMLSSNQALLYLPYPTQVLAKSCKPIPVLVFGVLFAGKRYDLKKYLIVLMIVVGVALFMYKDKKTATVEGGFGWGEILLISSLRYPDVLFDLLIVSAASCGGQYFIFKTVHEFSPLTCSILTTTRKLFTIIISVILFSHPLSQRQVLATGIVFFGLFIDAWDSKKRHVK
ncbi:unnamed protein product, partial [Mesorhabditis spiculigera]